MREMSLVSNTRVSCSIPNSDSLFLQPSSYVAMGCDFARDMREHCGRSDPLHPAIPAHNRPNTCDKKPYLRMLIVLSCCACQCLTRGFAFI